MNILIASSRRGFVRGLTLAAASIAVPRVFADQLTLTPKMGEGPFYPDKLPLDTDNDLLVVNNGITPSIGGITHLTARVLTESGAPLRNAIVEIWQCDQNGA